MGDKGKQFLKKYFMDGMWMYLMIIITKTMIIMIIFIGTMIMMTIVMTCKLRSWSLWWKSGQKLEDKQVEALAALPADASFLQKLLVKHRRLIGDLLSLSSPSYSLPKLLVIINDLKSSSMKLPPGILIPLIFFETCWWCQVMSWCPWMFQLCR